MYVHRGDSFRKLPIIGIAINTTAVNKLKTSQRTRRIFIIETLPAHLRFLSDNLIYEIDIHLQVLASYVLKKDYKV